MGAEIAGHILHKNFYAGIASLLNTLGQTAIDYRAITNGVKNLVETTNTHGTLIANAPYAERNFERAHDELLSTIDDQLVIMAHLIKISKFAPHIIAKLGPKIRYEDPDTQPKDMPKGEWRDGVYCHFDFKEASEVQRHNRTQTVNYWELESEIGLKPSSLWRNMGALIEEGYPTLEILRHYMSPKTEAKRRADKNRDAFCTLFRNGGEATPLDAFSRLEFQYFKRCGITLGLLDPSPDVAQWIANERRKPEACMAVINHFRQINDEPTILPGITLKDGRVRRSVTCHETRQIARELAGKIPESGIFIGDVLKTSLPPRGQTPRLVHST